VLIYQGKGGPVPSARLEQIRDGIEDSDVFNIVRQRRGGAGVRRIATTPARIECANLQALQA
jgi:hypothetical protein